MVRSAAPPDPFSANDGLPCDMVHVADLPFEEVLGHFLVNVLINDRPARLVFDTGAADTIVSPQAAERLGLYIDPGFKVGIGGVGGERPAGVRHADKINIGALHTRQWQFLVADFGTNIWGSQVDGLLGLDILSLLDIDLDIAGHQIRLYHPEHDCSSPSAVMHGPFYQVNLISHQYTLADVRERLTLAAKGLEVPMPSMSPTLIVMIGGQPLEAMLDSGAPHSLLYLSGAAKLHVTQAQFDADPHIYARGVGPSAVVSAIHTVPTIDIGDLEVQHVPLVLVNEKSEVGGPDMLLGADILRRIHVWISHSSHALIMQFPPTPSPQTPIPPPAALSPHVPAVRS